MNESEDYIRALTRYPVLQAQPDGPDRVLELARHLDALPVEKRRGWLREHAIMSVAYHRTGIHSIDSDLLLMLDQEIAALERYVRPVDLPPGRERGGQREMLTEVEMHTPLEELIVQGRWDNTFTREDIPDIP